MPATTFCNRRAVSLENGVIRVSVHAKCGHVAEILDTASGVNPLWIPPWPAIEPSQYSAAKHDGEYGPESGGKMLVSVMAR